MNKKDLQKVENVRLSHDQIDQFVTELNPSWRVVDHHHIERTFKFKDFKSALAFVNEIGKAAEEDRHHPDITLSYGSVGIKLYTHKFDGLSLKDFQLAKKIDAEYLLFSSS